MEKLLSHSLFEYDKSKPDLLSMDIINSSKLPFSCPRCKSGPHHSRTFFKKVNVLEGPFCRYNKRESELYFDLEKKYLHCTVCGQEIEIMDFQVIVDLLSSKLPSEYARFFSMKNMYLFDTYPDKMKMILSILIDDFELERKKLLPEDSLTRI